jgi:hypothetical protein
MRLSVIPVADQNLKEIVATQSNIAAWYGAKWALPVILAE